MGNPVLAGWQFVDDLIGTLIMTPVVLVAVYGMLAAMGAFDEP